MLLIFKYWKFSKITLFIKIKNYVQPSFSLISFPILTNGRILFRPGNMKYSFDKSYAYILLVFGAVSSPLLCQAELFIYHIKQSFFINLVTFFFFFFFLQSWLCNLVFTVRLVFGCKNIFMGHYQKWYFTFRENVKVPRWKPQVEKGNIQCCG